MSETRNKINTRHHLYSLFIYCKPGYKTQQSEAEMGRFADGKNDFLFDFHHFDYSSQFRNVSSELPHQGQSSQAWDIIHCLSSYLPIELVKLN